MTQEQRLADYYNQLRRPFQKLCRLRFLNPDGSTAFALDNSTAAKQHRGAFLAEGTLSVNLQNGSRRTAEVTISNADGAFDFNVNRVWFGQEIALDEGLLLSDGTEFYLQQGVFLPANPAEAVEPETKTVRYKLVDKWSNLDGTLGGTLEGTYEVPFGTNLFTPIAALLATDKGNGYALDAVTPVFTEYYNAKTQLLPDGSAASLVLSPYTLTVDAESGTAADVILGLAKMVNAMVYYDESGALRLDPSQDDITDADKPVLWQFSMQEATLLGLTYAVKDEEVYNDYIVIGEKLSDYSQPCGRAQNLDPSSDTCIARIGRKTLRESKADYGTDLMCRDYAAWKLKRAAALKKEVSIRCSQVLHLRENALVTVVRSDKQGSPMEKHVITGFTRPLGSAGEMTITAVSVVDYPIATLSGWPE